jgi:hypothetical protein
VDVSNDVVARHELDCRIRRHLGSCPAAPEDPFLPAGER